METANTVAASKVVLLRLDRKDYPIIDKQTHSEILRVHTVKDQWRRQVASSLDLNAMRKQLAKANGAQEPRKTRGLGQLDESLNGLLRQQRVKEAGSGVFKVRSPIPFVEGTKLAECQKMPATW